MEQMSPAISVPFGAGNLVVCDNPQLVTHFNITRIKLMADTTGLLPSSVVQVSAVDETCSNNCSDNNMRKEVSDLVMVMPEEDKVRGPPPLLDMISQNQNSWEINRECEEDDSCSLEGDQILDSLSLASETSSLCGEDFLGFDTTSGLGTVSSVDANKSICSVDIMAKADDIGKSTGIVSDPIAVAVTLEEETGSGSKKVLQLAFGGKEVSGVVGRSVFEVDYVPLWGFTSVCGRRPEMEDAVATVPHFLKIPIQMLIGDRLIDGMSQQFSQQSTHFFGVYDGHGGSQVMFIFPLHLSYVAFLFS